MHNKEKKGGILRENIRVISPWVAGSSPTLCTTKPFVGKKASPRKFKLDLVF